MVSITAPYMIPLFLGMTYDARNSKPGIDIYDLNYVDDPVITEYQQTKTTYSVVSNTEEINKALEVEGDLSLKIKTGMIDVEGKGSYIKNTQDYSNRVEILTTIYYTGKVESFKADAKPRDGWESRYSVRALGTHYVSSVTYGIECIASLRFVANNASNVEEIKGIVTATVGTGGNGADLTAEGNLEKMQKALEEKSSLEISYYCTVPLKSIPNSIDGLKKLLDSFPDQIKEANMTSGIPMSVELTPLGDISSEENRDKFAFLKNQNLIIRLEEFEMMFDELRTSRLDLTAYAKGLPYNLETKHEVAIGKLLKNITKCIAVFYEVVWKMDLTKGPEQLQPAFDAYNYDGNDIYNRYLKLVKTLILKLDPQIKRSEVAGDTYIHWGNNNCTANHTQVLYQGFMISSAEEGIGGVAQYECSPKTPVKGYELKDDSTYSHLAGIRYPKLEKTANPFKGKNAKKISETGVSCAKCYTPDSASCVMFSATLKCPLMWEPKYMGYLMSARTNGHTTQYICVDETPSEGYTMDPETGSKDTVALTTIESSGSLPSKKYPPGAIIRCVVCCMKSNQVAS